MREDRRSEERKAAEKKYLDSDGKEKLVKIAADFQLPASRIRKWKTLDKWDEKLKLKKMEHSPEQKVERSTLVVPASRSSQKVTSSPRKKGAPKGNKNAKGSPGPPNPSKNGSKHGVYSQPYWDFLDEDEKEIAEDLPSDEEQILIQQINFYALRERRIMKAIAKYRSEKAKVYIDSVTKTETKRSFKSEEEKQEYEDRIQAKVDSGDRLPGEMYSLVTNTQAVDNVLLRWEKELSSVQRDKTAAVTALYKLRIEKAAAEEAGQGTDVALAWTNMLLGTEGSGNGQS